MKSRDLGDVLNKFVKGNYRSVLIDGPWGCGKTYQIRKCIDTFKNDKPRIYYISLFGKESIDEINTELYRTIHPSAFKAKKISTMGLNMISKAFAPIPVVGGISGIVDALGFAINDLPEKNISGNQIIVFDDLERVDKALSYVSLLGYMNSLFLAQVRIVCLCSSGNIDPDKIDDFHDFKEK
ncbi:MAG: P-loop NTPase fold protein, partial [Candidatus Izemoplasmatales bacterium]|nr:P-loop NTPase fold protein [Candidatus Izemoplasmatales bacterium]